MLRTNLTKELTLYPGMLCLRRLRGGFIRDVFFSAYNAECLPPPNPSMPLVHAMEHMNRNGHVNAVKRQRYQTGG